ncbi:hypothetical protein Q4566_03915 [Tamlana sp. 2_MG-2023]|uniref:hypothetical protein n=1 Tax=unclassified Tamlana TaxID=2614803 RepID=UPI0026E2510C|nr:MULTISPECIES: hypothetical protein [unclassified Tamlana]MDO6759335.1 hypothetical protein [Tamlana sp. 2_MG-2023]MDO6790526.1 hypothetical protein [Tamlana sp. 1_MG-2023]
MKFKYIVLLVFVVILVIIAIPVSNYIVKGKIEKGLANLPDHVSVETETISVDVTSGTVEFKDITISVNNKVSKKTDLTLSLNSVLIEDIDYIDFVFSNKLNIDEVALDGPQVTYYKAGKKKKPEGEYSISETPEVNIKVVKILNGRAQVLDQNNDSLLFAVKHFKLNITDVTHKPNIKHRIPVTFHDFDVIADSIQLNVGEFDRLYIADVHFKEHAAHFKDLHFKTKYTKKELSKRLKKEKDYFDLKLDSLRLEQIDFGYKNDSVFYFHTEKTKLHKLDLVVYRDKLVADDLTTKPLFSKVIRDLNFDLNLVDVVILDAKIKYEERVNHEGVPGEIYFTDFNANLTNVSNTYSEGEKTVIKTTSKFMDEAPLETDWEFDVNNIYDRFLFKADLGPFHAVNINQFLVPNLNVKFEGVLHQTYFTIDGTASHSSVDLKTKFDGLRVEVLRKDKHEKNKFLSAIANVFVPKTTNKGESSFSEAVRHDIERDKTKSIFNFIWLNIKEGLIHAKN